MLPISPALAATPVALPQGQRSACPVLPHGVWELHTHGRIHPSIRSIKLPDHVRCVLYRGHTDEYSMRPYWRALDTMSMRDCSEEGCLDAMRDVVDDQGDWLVFNYGSRAPNVKISGGVSHEFLLFRRPLGLVVHDGDRCFSPNLRRSIALLAMDDRGHDWRDSAAVGGFDVSDQATLHVAHGGIHHFKPVTINSKRKWTLDVAGTKVEDLSGLVDMCAPSGRTTLFLHLYE